MRETRTYGSMRGRRVNTLLLLYWTDIDRRSVYGKILISNTRNTFMYAY